VDSAEAISNQICADGAGPVIVRVVKEMKSSTNRTKDIVRVVFSEKILANGSKAKLVIKPADIFHVWEKDEKTGVFTPMDSLLANITDLTDFIYDSNGVSVITFYMKNGKDLNTRHFLSIATASNIITDNLTPPNAPADDNHKQRVEIIQPKPTPPTANYSFPTPSVPTLKHVAAGVFELKNEPSARAWVNSELAGSIVSFDVPNPNADTSNHTMSPQTVRAYMKIYDMIGNPVQSMTNSDFLQGLTPGVRRYTIDIYWNGTNSGGMMVAPGVYRYVIYLDYNDNTMDTRLIGDIGIGR
jgi:hypothetical protein